MNQAILLNDDFHYDGQQKAWCLTGLLNGEKITIMIAEAYLSANTRVNDNLIFEIEDTIESWLDNNEPDHNQVIWLNFTGY